MALLFLLLFEISNDGSLVVSFYTHRILQFCSHKEFSPLFLDGLIPDIEVALKKEKKHHPFFLVTDSHLSVIDALSMDKVTVV